MGYITKVTDVTNRECNIAIQGQTNTATMSLILTANTAWEYKPDLVTQTAFRTRDDRLRNLGNQHNATYLNLPPIVKNHSHKEDHSRTCQHKN